jgi:hypothetical protein
MLKSKDTIEDYYHKIRKSINSHRSNIYLNVKYENMKGFNDVIDKLEYNLIPFCKKYNSEQTKIKLHLGYNIFIFYDFSEYEECEDFVCKFYVEKKEQTIKYAFDHEYIGGSYIRDLSTCLMDKINKPTEQFYVHSSLKSIFYFIPFCCKYITIPKIKKEDRLRLIDSPDRIRRYIHRYEVSRNIKNKIRSRSVVLYNGLKNIYNVLENKLEGRAMVCYLPVAFINTRNITNNIGLIWLEFDKNTTLESFNSLLYKSKYQALATNFVVYYGLDKLFRYFKKDLGSETRQSVDVVLTSIYYESSNPISLSWTYRDVSEYPIYLAISSSVCEDKIHVTETITSNIGRLEKLEQLSYQNYLI